MNKSRASTIRNHALALMITSTTVIKSRQAQTIPDPRVTALAVRIVEATKQEMPDDELLGSIEIDKGSWPVILAAMQAVLQVLPC